MSLFLPIVVSLSATVRPWLYCISSTEHYCFNNIISDYELFIGYYPILFGSIPYLIFLTASLIWISRKPQFSAVKYLIGAPLIFACILFIIVGSYYLFLVSIEEAASYSLFISMLSIVYGYVYVIAIGVIWFLIKSTGLSSNTSLAFKTKL